MALASFSVAARPHLLADTAKQDDPGFSSYPVLGSNLLAAGWNDGKKNGCPTDRIKEVWEGGLWTGLAEYSAPVCAADG
jgi:hypothetical protein